MQQQLQSWLDAKDATGLKAHAVPETISRAKVKGSARELKLLGILIVLMATFIATALLSPA